MVSDVSAMLVATTTLRAPPGGRWNTRRWSDADSAECRGRITLPLSLKRRIADSLPTTMFTCKRHTLSLGRRRMV
jgi:hypothetical protein